MSKNEIAIRDNNKIAQTKNAAWNSLAEESKKAYTYDYKLFFDFIKKDPKDINAGDILKFIEHLEENNYKNNSINRKVASLSKMFKVMVVAGEIQSNPVDALKQFRNISHKTSKNVNISLTLQDIKKAVKLSKNSTLKEKKTCLIIRTLAMTGLRISEFINIKYADMEPFDAGNQIVNIVGKGKKERKIYLDNEFVKEIQETFPKKKNIPFLFYNEKNEAYSRKVLWRDIHLLFKRKIDKDVHPHLLRHFFATHKIHTEKQDIKAVSKFLGHSSVTITMDSYVDTALDVKKAKIKI